MKWICRIITLVFTIATIGIIVRAYWLMPRVSLTPIAATLHFDRPTHMVVLPQKQGYLVAEKTGKIYFIEKQGAASRRLVADLSLQVYSEGWEEGLLSMAIDPDFRKNRYLYVFYSMNAPLRSRVARLTLDDGFSSDRKADLTILEFEKPHESHNGGSLVFGPDGLLYISIGESYVAKERREALLQSRRSLFGSIIRIDVHRASQAQPYSIPDTNPFVGEDGARDEIWAYGLRNPWRFSFIGDSQQIIVGDVGSRHYEEINIVDKGDNLGWYHKEGYDCFGDERICQQRSFKDPIAAFSHEYLRSITGGFVYRGENLAFLRGKYVFGDYLRGIFYMDIRHGKHENFFPNVLIPKLPTRYGPNRGRTRLFPSFAEDDQGELYAINIEGQLYRLDPISIFAMTRGFLYMLTSFR